jgi:DNA-binding NarL/FixJ family response regulator
MIRVLIVDDQKHVREGYCLLLRRESDLDVVGQARDGQEAVELAARLEPHVILMDIRMPRMDGLEATRLISTRPAAPRILVVAGTWEDDLVKQAIDCGATGYMAKPDSFVELPKAIREIARGQFYYSSQLAAWRTHDGSNGTE